MYLEADELTTEKLKVSIEVELVEKTYDHLVSILAKRVDMKGFRRGKAPRSVVEKFFSKEQIKGMTVRELIPEARKRLGIDESIKVESFTFNFGEPVEFIFESVV